MRSVVFARQVNIHVFNLYGNIINATSTDIITVTVLLFAMIVIFKYLYFFICKTQFTHILVFDMLKLFLWFPIYTWILTLIYFYDCILTEMFAVKK